MLVIKNILFLMIVLVIVSCTSIEKSAKVDNDTEILLSLSGLDGEYIWRDEINKYIYSKKLEIEKLISSHNKNKIIQVLVNCIDNISTSNSHLNKEKVKLGVLCYEALTQTIYHEPLLLNGDLALWSGHILPDADASQLKEAKRVWSEVIEKKKYHFL